MRVHFPALAIFVFCTLVLSAHACISKVVQFGLRLIVEANVSLATLKWISGSV